MPSGIYVNKKMFVQLRQLGEKTVKGVSQVMQNYGDKIRDRAREYAPVDEHDLEKAIVKSTNYNGPNRRSIVSIYVDMTKAAGVHTVGSYAILMHESLAIGLRREEALVRGYLYGLGPKSQKKDAGRGIVGGKFLTRAINDYKKEAIAAAKARTSKEVKDVGGRRRGRLELVR